MSEERVSLFRLLRDLSNVLCVLSDDMQARALIPRKLSIFRPVYAKVKTRWGRWLCRNETNNCDVRYKGESIYHHTHTLVWFLGFGIAWGYDYDEDGNHYIQFKHVLKWDHCEYGCAASRIWWGRMEIFI